MDGTTSENDQNKNTQQEDEIIVQDEEVAKLMENLEHTSQMNGLVKLVNYQGCWYFDFVINHILAFQKHFQAKDTDLIIASFPKTGNTWLKALLFAIVNRKNQSLNLLQQNHPHELVCFLEGDVYGKAFDYPRPRHLDQLPEPRLFHVHTPYHSLPDSIKTSGCRILYLTRNPLDTFVSYYYFIVKYIRKRLGGDDNKAICKLPTLEEFMEEGCFQEKCMGGPFFDHVMGYWDKSIEFPNKIMFLMYEDLKVDPLVQVKRIAEFIGFPFSTQEESDGVVQEIIQLCSFDNMKDSEANKNGLINNYFEKKSYFRKGGVGDWSNHFPPSTLDRLRNFMDEKIGGTGLSFRFD